MMIIDILKTDFCKTVNFELVYFLTVYEVVYNPCKNQLQIAFLLQDNDNEENRLIVKETFEIGSEKYKKLIDRIYDDFESEYTCVNTDDFDRFWGTCKLYEYNGQVFIDWENFNADSTPSSSFWKVYHPETGLKLY